MDRITVEGIEIYAYHGVFDSEKREGQKFFLSITMETDLHPAATADDLTLSTHYGEVTNLCVETATKQSYDLIETVAEKCAEAVLLSFDRVRRVTVTVSKPNAPIAHPFQDVRVEVTRGWHTVFLSYGSNLGDKRQYIRNGLDALRADAKIRFLKDSGLFETEPYGGVEQDDFLNGACKIETLYTPQELLAVLHGIEAAADRKREVHWGPRTLDLDILFYDDLVLDTEELTIPHPDLCNRAFVLAPMCRIAPHLMHPVYLRPLTAFLAASKGSAVPAKEESSVRSISDGSL